MNNEITLHYDELCTSTMTYAASMNGPAEYEEVAYDFETYIEEDDCVDFAIELTNKARKEKGDVKLTTTEQCAIDECVRELYQWGLINFDELRENKAFIEMMKDKYETDAQEAYEREE